MRIILRKLKPSDIKYFTKWWRDRFLLKLTSGVLKPISNQEVERCFNKMLSNKKDQHRLILLNNKNVIGHIAFYRITDKICGIHIIIGEKKYWGKGYGSSAIRIALKEIREYKYKKVCLDVRPDNLRAIEAYKKCGFKPCGFKKYPKNEFLPIVLKMFYDLKE